MAAQPPFSTNEPRSQPPSAFSATSWAGLSAAALKRSTHTAAASSLREVSAASCAIPRAVPPVVHPPQVKPTTMVATAHPAHDQNARVLVGRLASQRCPRLCLVVIIRLRGLSPRATCWRGGEPVASRNDPLACRPAAGARTASSRQGICRDGPIDGPESVASERGPSFLSPHPAAGLWNDELCHFICARAAWLTAFSPNLLKHRRRLSSTERVMTVPYSSVTR